MKTIKHTKRFILVVLSVLMIISVPNIAFAKEFAGTTPVSYVEGAFYTVSIPQFTKAQEYGEAINTSANTVRIINAQLNDGTTLAGTVSYSGVMTENSGATIPYKLVDAEGDVMSGNTIITHKAGSSNTEEYNFGVAVTEKPKYSGNYSDTAVFSFDVKEKTYTSEEIAADEHLYAIGKTKAEYVVAKFNDDYSSVTIFSNGDDSDGIMKDYQKINQYYNATGKSGTDLSKKFEYVENDNIGEASPMAKHGLTLNTAIIKPGVKNIGAGAFIVCDIEDNRVWSNNYSSEASEYREALITKYAHEDGTMGLRHISITETVEEIGDCAFLFNTGLRFNKNSTNATALVIPGSVKSIGKLAFLSFGGIRLYSEKIQSPEDLLLPIVFNEGLETIDELAFACAGTVGTPKNTITDASSVDISQFNTSFPTSLKNINAGAFSTTLVVGDITINGNVGPYAFSVSNFWGETHCGINETISKSLENVTVLGDVGEYAFAGHFNLDTINLLDGCTSVGEGAFSSYQTINIGNSLKDIAYSFSADLNVGFYSPVKVAGAFNNFEDNLYAGEENKWYGNGSDFNPNIIASRCKSINVNTDNPYFTSVDGVLFNKDITKLITYPAGRASTSKYGFEVPKTVTEIAMFSFECSSLDKILIPNSVINIAGKGVGIDSNNVASAFYNSAALPNTVYGVPNSSAQAWASNNNLQFVDCQDAYRSPRTVTVSYDANGGKGTMTSYTVTTIEPFNQMEFTLALKCPFTRNGYEFAGWAFKNNDTGEYLKNGESVIIVSAEELKEAAAELGDVYTFPAEDNFLGYDGSCTSYTIVAQWTALS